MSGPGSARGVFVRLLVGVLVLSTTGCSATRAASEDSPSTTTTAAPTTTTAVADDPIAEGQVWVLGDPDLTFVRIEPDKAVPLGAGFDDVAPLVSGTRLLLRYTTPTGGSVYLEQGVLVDPDEALELMPPPGSTGTGNEDGRAFVTTPAIFGEAPTLTTVAGGRRVVIRAAEEQLRPLAASLQAIDRTALEAMVDEVSATAVETGEAQPLVDGITLHLPPSGDLLACFDGQEPDGCAIADHYGPMVMAPIPQDDTYVVVGCILLQPVPVTEVVVNDQQLPVQTAPCGVAFSAAGIAPGTLTIAFDDGPGGVGTYTFDLP